MRAARLVLPLLLAAATARAQAPLVITDSLGRQVTVPSVVRRVISLEPEITRLIVALGAGETLVGQDYFLRTHDHLFPVIFPSGRGLPVVSNQGQDLNYELAIRLAPDIVFASPSETGMTESIQSKLRVPVAALASLGKVDSLLEELRLAGQIIGRTERAAELERFFQAKVAAVRSALARSPKGEKPRVYLSFWGSVTRTPVVYEPVDIAGGTNVAAGLVPPALGTPGTTISVESLLAWDPDIILVHGNYRPDERLVTVGAILADPRFRSLKAVKEKRVHYTFGYWYWWDPAQVLLEIEYLARLFHPESFPVFDLEAEGNIIYEKFYGVKDGFSAVARILDSHEWLRQAK
jgi:iron complex transport system substrate-binding protein